MNKIITILLVMTFLLLGCRGRYEEEPFLATSSPKSNVSIDDWHLSWPNARTVSQQQKRILLALFTGSDWCPWCVKLEEEILSTEAFRSYARENLILFKADFLQKPPVGGDPWKQQNEMLASTYQINGYPSILLLSPSGTVLGRLGYTKGGAKAFLQQLASALQSAPGIN